MVEESKVEILPEPVFENACAFSERGISERVISVLSLAAGFTLRQNAVTLKGDLISFGLFTLDMVKGKNKSP